MRNQLPLLIVLVLSLLASQLSAQIPDYTISFLDKPVTSNHRGGPGAINDHGQVVGSWEDDDGRQQVFRWDADGSYVQLSLDPAFANFFGGMNDEGTVAGTVQGFETDRGIRLSTPVVWTPDMDQIKLPPHPDAIVNAAWTTGINNNNHIVGTSFAEFGTLAVWWDENGKLTDIGVPEGFLSSQALSISDSGLVLGAVRSSYVKPFLWSESTGFEVIEQEKPIWIQPTAMNEQQQIVGWMNDRERAFIWDRQQGLTEIADFPGGRETIEAVAIGEDGLVIGEGYIGNTRTPFIWQRDESLTELQSRIIDLPDDWLLTDVGGFNSRGQISARAFYVGDDLNLDSALVVLTPFDSGFLKGDFNDDRELSSEDIDLLSEKIRESSNDLSFDINGDLFLDNTDRLSWLELAGALMGDSNLDGFVAFGDFLSLSRGFGLTGGWSDGDFDGSGDVQFADFLIQSANFGQSVSQTVPEPAAFHLGVSFLATLLMTRVVRVRRTRRSVTFKTDKGCLLF